MAAADSLLTPLESCKNGVHSSFRGPVSVVSVTPVYVTDTRSFRAQYGMAWPMIFPGYSMGPLIRRCVAAHGTRIKPLIRIVLL